MIQKLAPLKQPDYNKIFNALIQNLMPATSKNFYPEFFAGKMETFLTCRAVAETLRENILNKDAGNFFEELSLQAIHKTLHTNISAADFELLLEELPKILLLKYSVVENIRVKCLEILPQFMDIYRKRNDWTTFTSLDYTLNMLKVFER